MATGQLTYKVPMARFGLYSSPWPEDITRRSYLTDGFCGAGAEEARTNYSCPGPAIPIPRPDSANVGRDGKLVPER